MNTQKMLKLLIVIFLISPFLILLTKVGGFSTLPLEELIWVGGRALWQAFLSSALSLVVGGLTSLGLLYFLGRPSYKVAEFSVLLPGFLPPLFIIISTINTLEFLSFNPFGLPGIVFAHVLMNFGLVGVLIARMINEKAESMVELSVVEGASLSSIYLKGLLPLLRVEIFFIFLFVFSLCFTSFTVPMILGGVKPFTFSILMYNKIRIGGDWGQAMTLAFIESFLFFIFLFLSLKNGAKGEVQLSTVLRSITHRGFIVFPALLVALVVLGDLKGLFTGLNVLSHSDLGPLFQVALGTLQLGGMVSIFLMIFFVGLVYLFPLGWLSKFLQFYSAPSGALIGFSYLILVPSHLGFQWEKVTFALALTSVPLLYKVYFATFLNGLAIQYGVAKQMGAKHSLIFLKILFPQMIQSICFVSGLGGFWACGDFAISRIIAENNFSLSLYISSLLGSYQLDLATVLVWLLIFIGFILFIFWERLGYVLSRKFS